jgi:pSer/pThr/pTyr-binding forkhead associated (FHA) protein
MKYPPVIVVQLIHIEGPLKGEIQEFSESPLSVGRHPSSHVCFPPDFTLISRKHAEIIREGNRFKLIDHSSNGTFVNGKRVTEAYLKSGDVLLFAEGGPKVSFLTQMKEGRIETEAAPPRPEEPRVSVAQAPPAPPVQEPVIAPPRPEAPGRTSIQKTKVPLVIQYGPTLRSFEALPITIGRNPGCDFALDHPAILDHHAQVFFINNCYWVKDLTGKGLVQVNGQPIPVEAPLRKDDDVALSPQGPVFRFLGDGRLAEVEQAPPEEPLPPHGEEKGRPEQEIPQEKASKKKPSLLKKLLQDYINK